MSTETQPPTQKPAAGESPGYSVSTWLAIVVVVVLGLALPILPIVIMAGGMEDLVFHVAPIFGAAVWLAAMAVRVFLRKNRREMVWTALRYGVIAFGGAGLLVMAVALLTPGYIRMTRQFCKQMQQEANIAAIRDWAHAYQPPGDERPTTRTAWVFVPEKQWPDCIQRLHPEHVRWGMNGESVELIFGGGFGHWGLSVGPKGSSVIPEDSVLPVEDGAWVWYEIQ